MAQDRPPPRPHPMIPSLMFGFQRGRETTATVLSGGKVARLSYDRFAFLGIFAISSDFKWEVIGREPEDDVEMPKAEIESLYNVSLSEPGVWERWGLLIAIIVGLLGFALFLVL